MNVLKKYHEEIKYDLEQSKERIITKINKGKTKRKSFIDYFIDDLPDFEKIKVLSTNKFEIPVNPTMFNPLKGTGKIIISLKDNIKKTGTEIQIEIIPYNEAYVATIYLVFIFLVVWTVFGLAIRAKTNTFIVVAFGWIIFPFILFIIPLQNRSKLRKYRDAFIAMLKNKSSR
ncbi:hypothetical protein [Adhaeribacter pallidiroseus]|uniref:Uncharacterized protein n=1 Tax=Adhaeribacter pallidiroseus TaxID=2072847 RepID=A0A369QM90_9BACT|nr:hypothetical protein [Adhaeribacter pallidiroseus]RDC65460.1 hypothetical protein AHMF7616_04090 [Adhaeribacter pallidiroseus]